MQTASTARLYWLLLCWIGSTLSSDNPTAQNRQLLLQQISAESSSSHTAKLCSDSRCSCSHSSHGVSNVNVSCQCSPQDQEATLDLHSSSLPREVSHVVIQSCRSVIFHHGGIKHLNQLSIVTVVDVGEVIFHQGSFNQQEVERETTVTIGRCRQLTIKSGAFASHPQRPVAVYSSHCHSVRIEELAFSRLSRLSLTNIQSLHLASQAFRFATGSPDHIRTEILIEHVNMIDLKSFTFPSPLDRLLLENVTISGQIQPNATFALRIVQLNIRGSRIGSIATDAFSEFTHLDSLEMRSTAVDEIAGRAFASAASSFTLENCRIRRMNQTALSMPAARVTLRSNEIDVLSTGALYLREWNDLLIENNTVALVERHAFYNIGEPKLLPASTTTAGRNAVRFIIRGNVFQQVQKGAFIISAQVPQLKLEDNYFQQDCDCQMAGWAGQLTQITRRIESSSSTTTTSSFAAFADHKVVPDALWLGSSLFNSSLCWLDRAATECLQFPEPQFLSMNNYTDEFCSTLREIETSYCVATKRAAYTSTSTVDFQADGGSDIRLVGFSSRQDLVMIIVLGVFCAFVLLAVCLGLVVARFRSKSRQDRGHKVVSAEERVTCSPLIPATTAAEKQLGSGVVSSGSISRLSVKDYRNYLEELGPIYSEPLDPPEGSCHFPQKQQLIPPAVPAMPVQWTPKSCSKNEDANKRTIDRGTQTLDDTKMSESKDSIASVQIGEPPSSLALEFTEDVMAALRDKMDVSPLYSEVKDSISFVVLKEEPPLKTKKGTTTPELYDLIRVVDAGQRPSTSSAGSEHIYCKPWSAISDPLKSPLLTPNETTPITEEETKTVIASSSSPTKLNSLPVVVKSQPFHVRGSLPKWPPPVKPAPGKSRKVSSPPSASPPPTKDNNKTITRAAWQSSVRPTLAKKSTSSTTRSESSASQKTQQSLTKLDRKPMAVEILSVLADVASPSSPSPPQANNVIESGDEYAEVAAQPFSFSFRRPLFGERQEKNDGGHPLKPVRAALLCEYSDPRDLNHEPLYSELIVQEGKTD